MLIRVVRFRGRAPDTLTEASFGETGGTIGRSPQCSLSLLDPDRHISRIQAEINWVAGKFHLVDRGTANPVQHNGRPVGTGKSVPLADGDELHMGDYVLRVEVLQTREPCATPLDPFADLLPPVPGQPEMPADHPFASPLNAAGALIPEDFDPFSPKSRCIVPPMGGGTDGKPAQAPDPLQRQEASIDELFGLSSVPADPLGVGAAFGTPAIQPNTAASIDPFSALNADQVAPAAPMADDVAEIHGQFRLPPAHSSESSGNTIFRSWDSPEGESRTMFVGKQAPVSAKRSISEESGAAANRDLPLPYEASRASADASSKKQELPAQPPAQGTGAAQGDRSVANLQKAFLSGVQLAELPRDLQSSAPMERSLDAQTMEQVGMLLRLFAQGLIDLLTARAILKVEMRAEMTIISAQRNNPLKFSPDAATALQHLLSLKTSRGFMEPEEAVKDAMNDLIAHQVGVVAGMRAALQELLKRFHPEALEQRLARRSVLDSMLPMNRKAKLWELFGEVFSDVSKEAEDDFEALLSREFVKAYEAQIKNFEKPEPKSN